MALESGGDTINNVERMKLLDFILNNLENNSDFFNIKTVIKIRTSINENRPFNISLEQKNMLLDKFREGNNKFDRNTLDIFLSDKECIRVAINNDINSINFAKVMIFSNEDIISRAISEDFILSYSSPLFLKRNFEVVKKSIIRRAKGIDYSDTSYFDDNQIEKLINIVINSDYILSKESKLFLKKNKIVALNSIRRDIKSAKYMEPFLLRDKEIFKYLYINNYFKYKKNKYSILDFSVNLYNDVDIIRKHLREMQCIYDETDLNNYSKLIMDFLNQDIKISDFNELFSIIAEKSWITEYNDNDKLYNNVFSKITSELRTSEDFESSVRSFRFRSHMKDILGKKYDYLQQAMRKYYEIYSSNSSDKLKEAEQYRNVISELCSLYIAKSKESYKSRIIMSCIDDIFEVFIPNVNNKRVHKIISHNMKRNKFYDLYERKDEYIISKIDLIKNKYKKLCDEDIVSEMILNFLEFENTKLKYIITNISNYDEYVKYKKALKIINRLNRNYIKYDSIEVLKYKDVISFDNSLKRYVYTGISFTEDQILKFKDFEFKDKIFSNIKRDIASLIDNEVVGEIDRNIISEYQYDFPFTDEYYIFDKEKYFSDLRFIDVLKFNIFDGCINRNNYNFIYNFLINKRMLFLFNLIERVKDGYIGFEISKEDILNIVKNFSDIKKLANTFGYDLNDLNNLFTLNNLVKISSLRTISILGENLINKLSLNYNYNERHLKELFDISQELIVRMSLTYKSTVPYIEGETEYYKYSLYTNQDETLLSTGTDTDSCFKINGVDNDFLHYCALDKNGIVIKITDKYDNFIGRAAGFRNGNCLFLNQLRTIYDKRDNKVVNIHEKEDILDAFYKACNDIVINSKKDRNDKLKIDFVFINASYILRDEENIVDSYIALKIEEGLLDLNSEDYKSFITNTKNIECNQETGFETDYGSYFIKCVAKSDKELKKENLIFEDVDACYNKKRSKIIVTNKIDKKIYDKLNKIAGIYSYLNNEEFKGINIRPNATIMLGDNWYIIIDKDNIIDYRLIKEDRFASFEFMKSINSIYINNSHDLTSLNITEKIKIIKKETSIY